MKGSLNITFPGILLTRKLTVAEKVQIRKIFMDAFCTLRSSTIKIVLHSQKLSYKYIFLIPF